MDVLPGAVIGQRYRVDWKIGAGGVGEVWAGEHIVIGSKVALKRLLPANAANHELVGRFKREAYLLGRLQSDYVARVVDFLTDATYGLVLVMELIEGELLSTKIEAKPLSIEEALAVAVDVVSGLVDLHANKMVHRDVKPSNIILRPLPDGARRAMLVDFGMGRIIARATDEQTITDITSSNVALGTLEYMAPEQVLNAREVTESSDLYSVGALLFRAVAGHHVFLGTGADVTQAKLLDDAPAIPTRRTDRVARGFEAVIAKALRRRPSERYASAAEMLSDLVGLRELAKSVSLDAASTEDEDTVVRAVASEPREEPREERHDGLLPRIAADLGVDEEATATEKKGLPADANVITWLRRRPAAFSAALLGAAIVLLGAGIAIGAMWTSHRISASAVARTASGSDEATASSVALAAPPSPALDQARAQASEAAPAVAVASVAAASSISVVPSARGVLGVQPPIAAAPMSTASAADRERPAASAAAGAIAHPVASQRPLASPSPAADDVYGQ